MDSIQNTMSKIIRNCDVCIDGNVVSKELLIKTFSGFISSTIEDKRHNVGIVLHTGSICFDAILLAYAAISDVLYNETNANDIIFSLQADNMVLCYDGSKGKSKPSKWFFKGFVNSVEENPRPTPGKFIVLQSDKSGQRYLPESSWTKIVPYFGPSKTMDNRGLRRESGERYNFFRYVLGMEEAEIPRTVDTSTVIVMSREEANRLVGSVSFRFNGTDIKLTDLVPVSYYTEGEQEYQYGINPSKNEPVIKITGKVSVARKLLLRKGGNKHIGLVVFGEDAYRRGETELPELIDRQSIQYVYLCMHLDSEVSANLIANYEEASLFACTKDFLLSNSCPPISRNSYTEQMDAQIGAIIDKEVNATVVPGFINWGKYKEFKKAIYLVKSSEYSSDQKDDFIVQSYSLMNLFMTAVFPIGLLEDLIECGVVDNVEKPELRLHRLEETVKNFPDYLKDSAASVISLLEDVYLELHDSTPKEAAFLKALEAQQSKIAVVVPKAYFSIVIDKFLRLHNLNIETNIKDYLEENYARDLVSYYTIAGFACKICNTVKPNYNELKAKLEDYYISDSFPYKHVIIDEGQDFGSEAIEETDIIQLIHDIIVDADQGGTFYVFYDRLQLIQAREMPKFIGDLDCRLTLYRNCRNTENIAVTSLRPITERKPKVFEGAVKGTPAKIHFCDSAQNERERIDSIIDDLAADGYRDIVLLTCKTEATSILSDSVNNGKYRNKYLFTTCRKFKGLEADVVILLDVDKTTFEQGNALIFYVGTSRARIKLEIAAILSDDDCKEILMSILNYRGKIRRAQKDLAGALNAIGSLDS